MLIDRHIPGQLCEWIRVTGGIHLHLRDFTQKVEACSHPYKSTPSRNDESFKKVMRVVLRESVCQLLKAGVLVNYQRRILDEMGARLVSIKFALIRACYAIEHAGAVDQPQRLPVAQHCQYL